MILYLLVVNSGLFRYCLSSVLLFITVVTNDPMDVAMSSKGLLTFGKNLKGQLLTYPWDGQDHFCAHVVV